MTTCSIKKPEGKKLMTLFMGHLLLKIKKDVEEFIVEILMIIEEDPNPKKVSNVISATSWAT